MDFQIADFKFEAPLPEAPHQVVHSLAYHYPHFFIFAWPDAVGFPVPKGLLRIAQQFIAGMGAKKVIPVPEGRLNGGHGDVFSRAYGTADSGGNQLPSNELLGYDQPSLTGRRKR
jgi:hypothetical protein